MPVLNGKPYVDAALESVQAQTLRDIEIIVVDAGSTDGTLELLQQKCKEDPRIRVLASDQRSMGRQYNLGFDAAQGEYLAFCEADDEMISDFLEKAYAAAQANAFPDLVKFDFLIFRGDGPERYEMRYAGLPSAARKTLYGKVITFADCPDLLLHDGNHWHAIYRRSFLQENDIRCNETPGAAYQDAGFLQQTIFAAKSMLYVPELAYRYRMDNDGSSHFKPTAPFWLQELRFMMKKFFSHPEWKSYASKLLQRSFNQFWGSYANDCVMGRNHLEEDELHALQKELIAFLRWMDCNIRPQTDLTMLPLFLVDLPAFKRQAISMQLGFLNAVATFRDDIRRVDEVVIFSTSERGSAMRAFLHCNGFHGRVVFCDNDPSMQGKQRLGTQIYSPKEAVEKFPNATFIIPMPDFRAAMHCQLILLGVQSQHIKDAFFIDPWAAFMVDWETV